MAHELAHGVIEYGPGLRYQNQSGALNESYADVFGAMVDRDDWLVGEGIIQGGGFLRSLASPEAGGQPAHMRDFRNLPNNEEGTTVAFTSIAESRIGPFTSLPRGSVRRALEKA